MEIRSTTISQAVKLGCHYRIRRAVDIYTLIVAQLHQVICITLGVVPVEVGAFSFGCILQDGLAARPASPSNICLVEGNLEELLALMEAGQVVVLGDILHAEVTVRGRVVELGRIDQAGFHGRLNFTTGELHNRHAHFEQDVGSQANRAVFQTLHLGNVLDFFLEPAKRLRRHGAS